MIVGMSFIACTFIFTTLIVIIYFSKKHIITMETKLYNYIIILSILNLIIEFSLCLGVLFKVDLNSFLYLTLNRLFLVVLYAWFTIFTVYLIHVTNVIPKEKKIINVSLIAYIICNLLLLLLPCEIISENGMGYSAGLAVNFLIICCFLYTLFWSIVIFKSDKSLRKKFIPFIGFIICFTIILIIRVFVPGILLNSFSTAFATILMFHTIENPDVKLIKELEIAKTQAERANSAKTEFLSSMSHEIRTPLNAITGFSNILLEDETVAEKAKGEIRDIIMASENLLEIVNGILDISKIEANKIEIINNEYSSKKLFSEIVALTKGRIGDKPLELKVNIDQSIPPVLYGDAMRVKQICVNVLTNAVKYTKEGWIDFTVNVVQKDEVCRLIISVEDTGMGIKPENIDKLFNKFERFELEENITIEGTGLGLAITKRLVELMDGNIVVQSVFEKGSKFTISLDQGIVTNPTINLEMTNEIPLVGKTIIVNKKVLLVDDNKVNLKVAQRLLENYGLDIEMVESGFECLDKIKSGSKYDLILLDDMMPKMSGVETLQKLKELENFDIPTIALTANALVGMKEKYLNDGFDDYLAKPINKNELNKIVNKFLNNN